MHACMHSFTAWVSDCLHSRALHPALYMYTFTTQTTTKCAQHACMLVVFVCLGFLFVVSFFFFLFFTGRFLRKSDYIVFTSVGFFSFFFFFDKNNLFSASLTSIAWNACCNDSCKNVSEREVLRILLYVLGSRDYTINNLHNPEYCILRFVCQNFHENSPKDR